MRRYWRVGIMLLSGELLVVMMSSSGANGV